MLCCIFGVIHLEVLHIYTVMQCDRFSLITYHARAEVKFGLVCMTDENKTEAKRSIQSMQVGTCTNLCAGLVQGEVINMM